MSSVAPIKSISYVTANRSSAKKYDASRRKPVPASIRSTSSNRSTTYVKQNQAQAPHQDATFLLPRTPPLSPKPSVFFREVTVVAPGNQHKASYAKDTQSNDNRSANITTTRRVSRSSLKDSWKHLSLGSTYSHDGKGEPRTTKSKTRPTSIDKNTISRLRLDIDKAAISRPILNLEPRSPPLINKPLPSQPRHGYDQSLSINRTIANATPPVPTLTDARTSHHAASTSAPLDRVLGSSAIGTFFSPNHSGTPTPGDSNNNSKRASIIEHNTNTAGTTPLEAKSQWYDSDEESESLDERKRLLFKRLIKKQASLKSLKEGFESAVEGVKRQAGSRSHSVDMQGATASRTVPTTQQSHAHTKSQPLVMGEKWVSDKGVPQGKAVKRRSLKNGQGGAASSQDDSKTFSRVGLSRRTSSRPGTSGRPSSRSSSRGGASVSGLNIEHSGFTRPEQSRSMRARYELTDQRGRDFAARDMASSRRLPTKMAENRKRNSERAMSEKGSRHEGENKEKSRWWARLCCG